MQNLIREKIGQTLNQFPHVFDRRIHAGLDRLCANTPTNFFALRSYDHLKMILIVQFFLQRRMEKALLDEKADHKHLFIKLFHIGSRICCALSYHPSYGFNREQLTALFHTLLPGIQVVYQSWFTWFHPDLSYHFCYFEVDKMRGGDLFKKDLKNLEKSFREQLQALPPLTPALFWPYNTEESFRQIQLLQREIENPEDLPHISILFQEQSPVALEFLVHYARPLSSLPIEAAIKQLPHSFEYFFRFKRKFSFPFPIEAGAFSIKVPSAVFTVRGSINLLYARRYIAKYLESTFGPFRDYNGGLFEKQQAHFELLRVNLSNKIPLFDLFAEKIFYALHPVEARLALSITDAEKLFVAFAEIVQKREHFCLIQKDDRVIIVKNGNSADWLADFEENSQEVTAHAHLSLGTSDYLCCIGPQINSKKVSSLLAQKPLKGKKIKTLKLSFQEGAPPSLNPHLCSGDMRCRIFSKLLFEGLMRLNGKGQPEPAGATNYFVSPEGTQYVFKLRPCYWSNGDKVTAIDYIVSWQRALRDPVSHPEQLFVIKNGRLFKEAKCQADKLGIRALDTTTLEIELERSDPYFLYKLAHPFFFPLLGSMREPKWFNGPYLIRNQLTDGLVLEKNPYFWGIENLFFEQIEIKWNHDLETIYQSFQEGHIDWIGDPLCSLSPHLIDQLQIQGFLKTRKVNRRFLLHFNTQHPHLSNPSLRQALSHVIKRSELCELFPYSYPISLPTQVDCPMQLFEEGLKQMGLTRQTFPPITFSYSTHTGRERLALYLKNKWEEQFGLTIQLEQIEWNLFRNKLEKGEFEITVTIQETLDNAPLEFLDRFEGSNSWNFSQWRNPLYREMINKAYNSLSADERMHFQHQAEQILYEEMPFTPLFICTHLFAHRPELGNYFFDSEGCVDFARSAHFMSKT